MIDVVRLQRLVAYLELQHPASVWLRPKAVHIPGFKQWRNAVGEQLSLLHAVFRIYGRARFEDGLKERDSPHEGPGSNQRVHGHGRDDIYLGLKALHTITESSGTLPTTTGFVRARS